MRMAATIVTLLIAWGTFAADANAELIINGDFESGNMHFGSDFSHSPGDITAAKTYDVLTDPNDAHTAAESYGDHTTGSGNMLAANGSTDTSRVWFQSVSVKSGIEYEFSVWTSTWFDGDNGPGELQLKIGGTDVGTVFSTPSDAGVWEQTTRSWLSDTTGDVELALFDTSTLASGNDYALDDISFVPEPSSFFLFGMIFGGGVAFGGRRRRNRRQP